MINLFIPILEGGSGSDRKGKLFCATSKKSNDALTRINGLKPRTLISKIEKCFFPEKIDFSLLDSEKNPFEDFSGNTDSISLGIFCSGYATVNDRSFKAKYDSITITGDFEVKEDGIKPSGVIFLEEKFELAEEYAVAHKDENHLFIYVAEEEIIRTGRHDNNILVMKFDSKSSMDDILEEIFEDSWSLEQAELLKKIPVSNRNEFVKTETYVGLQKIIREKGNLKGVVLAGKSNSGKTIQAYNLCLDLMRRGKVFAPIWLTIDNERLQEKISSRDIDFQNIKGTDELAKEYLYNLISGAGTKILDGKKYVLVIDNLELDYADVIERTVERIISENSEICFSIITSWFKVPENERTQNSDIEQIELQDVSYQDFSLILDSIIDRQFTTRLQLLKQNEKSNLTEALFDNLKDCPGDLPIVLSSLQNISVQELISMLERHEIDSGSRKNFFYELKFEQTDIISKIVLFLLIEKFRCSVKGKDDIKKIEELLREKRLINPFLLCNNFAGRALRQLSSNYIINEDEDGRYYIKTTAIKYFLFLCKDNEFVWTLSRRFISTKTRIHFSIMYNWKDEFKELEINKSLFPFCILELAKYSRDTQMLNLFFTNQGADEFDVGGVRGYNGLTALHLAAYNNPNPEVMDVLVEHGADFRIRDDDGRSVLMSAAWDNKKEVVEYVLSHKLYEDINEKDEHGLTALHWAASYNSNPEVMDVLVEHGADFRIRDYYGMSVLMWAAKGGNKKEVVEYVLSHKLYEDINEKDEHGRTALHYAASYHSNRELMDLLVKHGADFRIRDDDGMSVLMRAVWNNKKEVVEYILSHKLYEDINEKDEHGRTALHLAVFFNIYFCYSDDSNRELMDLLVKHGADFRIRDDDGRSVLMWAAWNNKKEVVEYVLSHKLYEDINEKDEHGLTALHWAASYNSNPEVMDVLVEHGADFRIRDYYGRSVLMSAARNNKKEVVEYVLSHKLYEDINEKDEHGLTALHWAAFSNPNPEIVRLLLKYGCLQTIRNNNNSTVLHAAANNNEAEDSMVKLLVEEYDFKDINAKNNFGDTALHTSAKANNVSAFEYLVNLGLNPHEKNLDGESPLVLLVNF